MAGLCAAARAAELGLGAVVLEKGDRAGGSMLLSSGVIWRHRTLDEFREDCPRGDPVLQAVLLDRLDAALGWLESLGAPVLARETGNPRTVGVRFDPAGLTVALVRAAGDVRLEEPLDPDARLPVLLATGGFGGELTRRLGLPLRANRWSEGDGLRFALAHGAAFSGDHTEFYGRLMPAAPIDERDFVRAAQLYGRVAVALDDEGRELSVPLSWSEVELPQALARAGGSGWLVVDAAGLRVRVRDRTVAELVVAARDAGAVVVPAGELPFPLPSSPRLVEPPFTAVRVTAAVTHTIGGLRIDAHARVLDVRGEPIADLFAAGADAGGLASGGYASGLAGALVFGRIAAETAAGG
jgi:succinate dehydrogenase/fumarate reductase flavoprotein subunit